MRYRKIGSSNLEVSEISLGSWLTYAGGIEAEQTRACTEAAFEAGINFFDTANVYGRGAAESAWGEILSRRPRDPPQRWYSDRHRERCRRSPASARDRTRAP